MTIRVIKPNISCIVNMPLSAEETNDFEAAKAQGIPNIYVVSSDGLYHHQKLRGEGRYIRLKVESVPGMEQAKLGEVISFLPGGKIPKEIFDQILSFFHGVMKARGQALEAMTHILWNKKDGYHIGIPEQQVSAASVHYDYSYIPNEDQLICDIHSH